MNRYLSAIIILAALTNNTELCAQSLMPAPRLVVNIIIDQLRTDYIEQFSPLYTPDGFKKLLQEGCVYEAAQYPFSPVDRASAVASISTGTTPQYNNIVAGQWLDRATLRPVFCTDDEKYGASPAKLATSTISDELKVATRGTSIIYSIAQDKDAAILSGGHAADGAFWINKKDGRWTTSSYYSETARNLVKAYNNATTYSDGNDAASALAITCVDNTAMGRDETTDMLYITLSGKSKNKEKTQSETNRQTDIELVYLKLDNILADIIKKLDEKIGNDKILYILTGTGYTNNEPVDYSRYRIPTGTFYINRTANLLNMYLGAIYGQAQYVETCFHNQIYIDRKLLEQRHISFNDVVLRSKELLTQAAGVRDVTVSPYSTAVSGDLVIEVSPGWQLVNEDNQEEYTSRTAFVPFPIIIYGVGTKPERVITPVTVDRIAPTIAKAIRIRAPNACSSAPLQ